MKIVLLFNAPRHFYRDVIVGDEELYCSPAVETNTDKQWRSPEGLYDVPTFLASLPEKWREPDLLLTHFDMMRKTVPRNLSGVKCQKVLMLGDTHHMPAAIRNPLNYALEEPYDLTVAEFDRQHLHFFLEAGIRHVGWIPCFTLRPFEEFAGIPLRRGATFVGQAGQWHPYRRAVLHQLLQAGVKVEVLAGQQRDTARVHAESRVNLNISLNGDLNLRILEVMAVGGFLITDRLSPESGLPLLFEENRHLAIFDGITDLKHKIEHYLANASEAAGIAKAGHMHYLQHQRPQNKIEALHSLLKNEVRPMYDLNLDKRTTLSRDSLDKLIKRIIVYESLQELHRVNGGLGALFFASVRRHATDAADLPRLRVFTVSQSGAEEPVQACGMEPRIGTVPVEDVGLGTARWNIAVCSAAELESPLLRQFLSRRGSDFLMVADADPARDGVMIQQVIRQYGLCIGLEKPLTLTHLAPAPQATGPTTPGGR